MTLREEKFLQHYTIGMLLMKVARINLDMAKDFCDHRQLEHTLAITSKFLNTRVVDVGLKLKGDSYRTMQGDLNSEELQALASILHELLLANNIAEMESNLVRWIKNIRKVDEAV